jgi:hypothetical protein
MFPHGRDREIPRWRDVARRSRLFGRDAQVVAMVCRTLSVGGVRSMAALISRTGLAGAERAVVDPPGEEGADVIQSQSCRL